MTKKPTVFSQPPAMPSPTTLLPGEPSAQHPTVPTRMPSNTASASSSPAAPAGTVRPTTVMPSSIPATITPAAPDVSRMQGVVREGLKVPMAELESHFPGQTREMMEVVEQALAEVTPAVFGVVEIAEYGIDVQQQYAQSVHAWMRLLENDAIRQTPRHIERLHHLLAQVANAWNDKSWFRRTTPKAKYEEVRAEVEHLVALLTNYEGAVLQARLAVQQAMGETEKCLLRAMGYQMASEYLGTILFPDKAGGLMERSLSLASTVTLLQAQQMQMQQQDMQLGRMMNTIREGILVALPAWTTAVIASEHADMNETQQFMLKDQLTAVLYKFTH